MMFRVKAIWVFAVVAAVQLFVPGYMIHRYEDTLNHGQRYWFKVGPVDPYDPFRGRYVRVNVEANSAMVPPDADFKPGEWVYVGLGQDAEGFATLTQAERKPLAKKDYLRVRTLHVSGQKVFVEMPFTRYYAEEQLAPEIEQAYWRNSTREQREAVLLVRIKDGSGVIEDLYIQNMPVGKYLESQAADGEKR